MYFAKYGIIAINGGIAKPAVAHDFQSYSDTYVYLQAALRLSHEARNGVSEPALDGDDRSTQK